MFNVWMVPATTSTRSTVLVGKPEAATETLYRPRGISWKVKIPSLVVAVVWSMLVAVSVAFTAALGTTAPEGSVTVPLIAPRKVCALAGTTHNRTNKSTISKCFIFDFLSDNKFWQAPCVYRVALHRALRSGSHVRRTNHSQKRCPW